MDQYVSGAFLHAHTHTLTFDYRYVNQKKGFKELDHIDSGRE